MSKKFDAEAYVAAWEARVIPGMLAFIALSFVLVVILNVKTRPECLRHEYIYCGTPSQSTYQSSTEDLHHSPHP